MDFEQFWQLWPVKKNRSQAEKAWTKIGSSEVLELCRADIAKRIESGEWDLEEKQYIPHASTYLNQERFRDKEHITKNKKDRFSGMNDKEICQRVEGVMFEIWGHRYKSFVEKFPTLKEFQLHWKNYIPYLKENIERLDQAKDRITRDRIAGNTNLDFPSIPTILQYMGPVKSSEVKKYREPTQEERENQKVVVSKLKEEFNEY